MDYFVSHLGILFIAACCIAACAVAWWYLTDRNARMIRKRAEARKTVASAQGSAAQADTEEKK